MFRPRAETMPADTEPPSPNGLPMAMTQSPGRILSESPNGTAFSVRSAGGFTRRTARSIFESLPTISAFSLVPSCRMTWMSLASPMTWLFVTTRPAESMMKPEPSEFDLRCWRGPSLSPPPPPRPPRRLKNSSNRSSNGVPGGTCGPARPARASTVVDAEMFTTASVTCSARSAREAGPLAKAGTGRAAAATETLTEAPIRIEAISARARERGCAGARPNSASGALATGCMVDLFKNAFPVPRASTDGRSPAGCPAR